MVRGGIASTATRCLNDDEGMRLTQTLVAHSYKQAPARQDFLYPFAPQHSLNMV